MRITILLLISLLLWSCVRTGPEPTTTPNESLPDRPAVTVTSVETDIYKLNHRIKLNFQGETRVRAEADRENVNLIFDRRVTLSVEAERQLSALKSPCNYSKSAQKDPLRITLRCAGNVKVYPEKGEGYFDLILVQN